MKNLTLKQLRYFEALARDGRFRLAAEACAISQPALSMQIKELEAELGNDLFERSAREVKLTAFGETFALRARAILSAVDELADFARTARSQFLTRLRIGIIPTVAPYLLPAIIKDLNAAFEGIQIEKFAKPRRRNWCRNWRRAISTWRSWRCRFPSRR